jgi:hypothetical protein
LSGTAQQLFEPFFIEVEHDRAVDVEGGCDEMAVAQRPRSLLRTRRSVDIDLRVGQTACLQPFTRGLAVPAPFRAVHHDTAARQVDRLGLGRFNSRGLRVDAPQFREEHLVVGLIIDVVDVDIPDNSLPVEDEEGAFRVSLHSEHAVPFGDLAVGPEIAQQGEADVSEALRPRFENGYMIDADAQNLGVQSRELGELGLIRRDLVASDRREGLGEEGQHDVLTPQVAQRDVLVEVTGQCKIRSFLAGDQLHRYESSLLSNGRSIPPDKGSRW